MRPQTVTTCNGSSWSGNPPLIRIEPCDTMASLLVDPVGCILSGLNETGAFVMTPESVEEHPEFYDLFFVLGDGDFAVQRHKNNLRQDRPRGAICLTGSCIKPIFCIDTKPSNLVWIYQVITGVLL